MTDEELVRACLRNEASAQKLLFDRFSKRMMGVCLRYAGDHDEAEDMLQNGFIRIFEKLETFRGDGSLEGWIRRIVVNEALTWLRKNKESKMKVDIEEEVFQAPTTMHVSESLEAKDLMKLVQQLPTGFRTVFNLYAIEGYSHREIADQLGISEGTSKSQYARAKTHLQNLLKNVSNIKQSLEEHR